MTTYAMAVPDKAKPFVKLAQLKESRLFRKEIMRKGKFSDPRPGHEGEFIEVDDELFAKLTANFTAGVCDIVQIPVVGDDNKHTEAPDRNSGEVVGLEVEGDSLIAVLDFRKPEVADAVGKTLLGASAMYAQDYKDTKTGDMVGPTLLHVAVTNRPHITGLDPFRELIAATSDQSVDEVVAFTATATKEEVDDMTLEEMLAKLKAEHNIDVTALQAAAATPPPDPKDGDLATKLAAVLVDAGVVKLSAGDPTPKPEDIVSSVKTVTDANVALATRVSTLELSAVTTEIDGLIVEGRVMPHQKDAMIKLAVKDRETFDAIVPAEPLIKLSKEEGNGAPELPTDKAAAEIDRLVDVAAGNNGQKKGD